MNYYEEEAHVEQINWQSWKKMLALLRPYRSRLITVAVLMLISAAIDVALPLFQSYAA